MAVLMACVLAANYARTALGPVQEALKTDLSLNDNEIALLQGPALALPVVIGAVPLGFLIDTYSRARLILLLAALNVVGTALTSVVSSVPALFLARALVGLAATATFTAVLSVVADIYAPHQRGRANTAVSVAQIAGMSIAFALGGALLESGHVSEHAWRGVMMEMSAPLVVATLLMLALREPPRFETSGKELQRGGDLQRLWSLRVSLGPLLVGMVGVETALGAAMTWAAPTLSRTVGLSPGRIGELMAVSLAISGVFGPVLGGTLADFCHRKAGVRLTMKVIACLAGAAVPAALFAVMSDVGWAGALLVVFLLLISAACVMGGTLFSIVAPGELRGQAIAVMTAASILFAVGVAPMAVSLLAGALGGGETLGSALAWVSAATSGTAAAVFAWGRRYVKEPVHV
jgi:MFS family permease